jgi:predicted lipoprotein with Yx(FWY)xxD motif
MSSTRPLRGRRPLWLLTAVAALIALTGLATLAIAKTNKKKPKPLVKTAHSATQNATILVDANGRTLYELRPETAKHVLCKTSACLQFWPPDKVGKKTRLAKGAGVKGSLGRLHRKGFDQLTLDRHPLYHFSGDPSKGSTNGQGIRSFGGTWHVVKESSSSKRSQTTTTTSTSTSPYGYPTYP